MTSPASEPAIDPLHALWSALWSYTYQVVSQRDVASFESLKRLSGALLSLGMTTAGLVERARQLASTQRWHELDSLWEDAVALLRDDLEEVWAQSPDGEQWLRALETMEVVLKEWFADPAHVQRVADGLKRLEASADAWIARMIELAMDPPSREQLDRAVGRLEQLEQALQAVVEQLIVPRYLASGER